MGKNQKKYGTGNDALDAALLEDRELTSRWYLAMCGQLPWLPGEKEENALRMECLGKTIREGLAKQTAEWFSRLPV